MKEAEWTARVGWRLLIVRKWKTDRVKLLMWHWKDNLRPRMTPRLFTFAHFMFLFFCTLSLFFTIHAFSSSFLCVVQKPKKLAVVDFLLWFWGRFNSNCILDPAYCLTNAAKHFKQEEKVGTKNTLRLVSNRWTKWFSQIVNTFHVIISENCFCQSTFRSHSQWL